MEDLKRMAYLIVGGLLISLPAWSSINEDLPSQYQDHLAGRAKDPFATQIPPTQAAIERFSLEEFRIVTIMWGQTAARAIVMDPYKNKYTLRINDRIGKNSGVVSTIKENEIVVTEDYNNVKRRRVLRMRY